VDESGKRRNENKWIPTLEINDLKSVIEEIREERNELKIAPSLKKPPSLEPVVMVGLWNCENNSVVELGSGFIADYSKGLILTAGHIFYDILEDNKIGPRYKGLKNAKAIIGTIQKTKEGDDSDTCCFTHFAQVITHPVLTKDDTKVDAVVLKITSKIEKPFQVPEMHVGKSEKHVIDNAIMRGDNNPFNMENKTELDLCTTSEIKEEVDILGFNQSGEDRHEPGEYINYNASIAIGYVCGKGHSGHTSAQTGPSWVSLTRSETIVENCPAAYVGISGGPCVNRDGKVIGILCRGHKKNERRCYLAPASNLDKILRKAKKLVR